MDATQKRSTSSPSLWQELEAVCAAAIRLSQDVAVHLRQGAKAHAFTPLLHREKELIDQLCGGIHLLDQQAPDATACSCRAHLAQQMQTLLDLEQQNHRLLSRKGIKLSGPQFNRYHPPRP